MRCFSTTIYQKLFSLCSKVMLQIVEGKKPVIAKVHGAAYAAGCQLVASCDLAYSTNDASFATPGVNIGLFCSTPMVALSRVAKNKHAMEMLLTGDFIQADKAKSIGLIRAPPAPRVLSTIKGIPFSLAKLERPSKSGMLNLGFPIDST